MKLPTRLRKDPLFLYFSVPSSEGFGPYRTGRGVHLLFSISIGGVLWIIQMALKWQYLYAVVIIFAVVLILWGIGTWLGISSHYNLLIWLIFPIAWGIMVAFFQRQPWFPFTYGLLLSGCGIGYVAHIFWSIILPKQ